jgi:hypothetical protein
MSEAFDSNSENAKLIGKRDWTRKSAKAVAIT